MRRIAVLLVAMLLAGCDGYLSVQGRALDPAGKPIAGASVSLMTYGHSRCILKNDCTTDATGRYEVGLVGEPIAKVAHTLIVSKDGFKTHCESLQLQAGKPPVKDITLERYNAP